MRSRYAEDFVRRQIATVLAAEPPPKRKGSTMPKVLQAHEFKAPERATPQSKYDWTLFLSGQIVQLDAGTDYDPVGKDKDGKEFDRTDAFKTAIKARAYDSGKSVRIDEILNKKGDKVLGLIIQATPMTPEQIAERKAAMEKRAKEKAEKEKNGTPATPGVEAEAGAPLV